MNRGSCFIIFIMMIMMITLPVFSDLLSDVDVSQDFGEAD